jgi:hypothetical protein
LDPALGLLLVCNLDRLELVLEVCPFLLVAIVEAELALVTAVQVVPLLERPQSCLRIARCVGSVPEELDFVLQFQGNCNTKCS